jgi:hypothetical protein
VLEATRRKEIVFMMDIVRLQAGILMEGNESAAHLAKMTIRRVICRFEFFRMMKTRGPAAAEVTESSFLDAHLPSHIRNARRAGETTDAVPASRPKEQREKKKGKRRDAKTKAGN